MIQCDHCKEWFHLKCVGLNGEQIRQMTNWMCLLCDLCQRKNDKNEDGDGINNNNNKDDNEDEDDIDNDDDEDELNADNDNDKKSKVTQFKDGIVNTLS